MEFNDIKEQYKGQVDRLSEIIEENSNLLKQIEEALETQVMQTVLEYTLVADQDKSLTLSRDEMKNLKFQLSLIDGVHLNEKNFDEMIGADEGSHFEVETIMSMFRKMKDPTIPKTQNVFVLQPEKLLKKKTSFLGL